MAFVADLHLHSGYSYACIKNLALPNMASWAKVRGIDLLSTADFTRPGWMSELEQSLETTKDNDFEFEGVKFVLGTEISCVYKQGRRARRVHLLVYAPTFEAVRNICKTVEKLGSKLNRDGLTA